MTQMTISDLSFCENTGTNAQAIKGSVSSPRVSTSVSKNVSSRHNAFFNIEQLNSGYLISAGYAVAVAAGVAAAISVGGTTYTSVNVFSQVG
ncbi:hypothetical protein [Planktothrix paucivesiculata]|uniref:Uncharacterized protein n=1 Tax=Planktothrix paucivesiculata PCC 9631 TaxID=671071 RepID=A0A7Z9DXT1_9CYAN|nr:hypothetical protein [Planktothrix paucivesiculata]VXD15033.1 hypothetical protein PL9631_1100075 [Planktothrix paucivesiculata PCC 9631]